MLSEYINGAYESMVLYEQRENGQLYSISKNSCYEINEIETSITPYVLPLHFGQSAGFGMMATDNGGKRGEREEEEEENKSKSLFFFFFF